MQKVVLVSGITGGIGQAILNELAYQGDYLVAGLYCKNKEQAQALSEKYNADILQADITKYEDIVKCADKIIAKYHKIDILVNNAGISEIKPFTDYSCGEISAIIDINLKGTMFLTKAVLPYMISQKSGKIINIGSIWGVYGGSCEAPYSASKAGIIGFTKALSREVGPSNITVNCIAPGFIDTKMNGCIAEEDKKAFLENVSLMKSGTPQDVAHLVKFLCSSQADYITGQVIGIDGGY
ncbi:MAG: elongation factor P 5-aminopentanone reductase [Christensenellales bacterium]|nr:3-oxoacyl-ACP reductase FabG [Clostridiales bacterium]